MILSDRIHTTQDQYKAFIENFPKNTPLVMINILRFRDETPAGNESGLAAYKRYSKNTKPFLEKVGGKMIWFGYIDNIVVGDVRNKPHVVSLIKYPSIDNYLQLVNNPDFRAIAETRGIALEYGGLLAAQEDFSALD